MSTGPRGLQGVTGPRGLQGVAGPVGATGARGLQGVTGPRGLQGVAGPVGATGPRGLQGVTGARGLQGVFGSAGATGSSGATGIQGLQGVAGPAGATGVFGTNPIFTGTVKIDNFQTIGIVHNNDNGELSTSLIQSNDISSGISLNNPTFTGDVCLGILKILNYSKIGNDIDGISDSQSGTSVSLSNDGTILAIGAPFHDNNKGYVRIYKWNETEWIQLGYDIIGKSNNDEFGLSISISGDGLVVAVGAINNSENPYNRGSIRVYKWMEIETELKWTQLGDDINGESNGDLSGWSVSLSNDGYIVAIGAINNDGNTKNNADNRGHVRVYNFDYENNVWNQRGIDIDGEISGDVSGFSVSLSDNGNIVAIGATSNDGVNNLKVNSGVVRVYKWNENIETPSWTQHGDNIYGIAAGDNYGTSISISADGTILAIGSTGNDDNGNNSGQVRIFNFNETQSKWLQRGQNINGEAVNDASGWSISLSGDGLVLAIGSQYNNSFRGHVRIYQWNENIWVLRGEDIDGETPLDNSGTSVSISYDGSIIAIGAKSNSDNGTFSGHVRVYKYKPASVFGITKSMVGLENVDNTSDSEKPISIAQQIVLDSKTPLILANYPNDTIAGDNGIPMYGLYRTGNDLKMRIS